MLALVIALVATVLLMPAAQASTEPDYSGQQHVERQYTERSNTEEQQQYNRRQSVEQQYTVWASVVFARTGEHTPDLLPSARLTSLGAQQAFAAGNFYRHRYVASAGSAPGVDSAPLHGLGATAVDADQLYALALDTQASVATANAFLQGLYPPFLPNGSAAGLLDSTAVVANGSYVPNPLDGYQYIQLHTASALDPEYIYISGSLNCPAWQDAALTSTTSSDYTNTREETKALYRALQPLLSPILPDPESWDYINAHVIYEYLAYENTHNSTAAALLNSSAYSDSATGISYLESLRYLSNQQQYAYFGNLTAFDNTTSSNSLPNGATGSISTIPGNTLIARLLSQLQLAVAYGGTSPKLSLLFGDYQPLLSLFALTDLPRLDSNFLGLPDFASTLALELYSFTNNSMDMTFPPPEDLWVQLYFRNGSDPASSFRSYPIFDRGPSETEMPWPVFQALATEAALGSVADWCTACGNTGLFCQALASEDGLSTLPSSSSGGSGSSNSGSASRGLSGAVAGVIGALIALAIAALLFALLMLFAGLRFYRNKPPRKDSGGFKGSSKLASDRDLSLPAKSGAVVGATVERDGLDDGVKGHERVGSWEMKNAGTGTGIGSVGDSAGNDRVRPSFEHDEDDDDEEQRRVNPFADPVKADERV